MCGDSAGRTIVAEKIENDAGGPSACVRDWNTRGMYTCIIYLKNINLTDDNAFDDNFRPIIYYYSDDRVPLMENDLNIPVKISLGPVV